MRKKPLLTLLVDGPPSPRPLAATVGPSHPRCRTRCPSSQGGSRRQDHQPTPGSCSLRREAGDGLRRRHQGAAGHEAAPKGQKNSTRTARRSVNYMELPRVEAERGARESPVEERSCNSYGYVFQRLRRLS